MGRGISQRRKKAILNKLYRLSDGRCQRCGCPVGLAFVLLKQGWKIKSDMRLHHPHAPSLACASIEHVKPRHRGGSSRWNNLRLFCRECNGEANDEMQNTLPLNFGDTREAVPNLRGGLGGTGTITAGPDGFAFTLTTGANAVATGADDPRECPVELRAADGCREGRS